jgi:quinol monooxygenase YgiN
MCDGREVAIMVKPIQAWLEHSGEVIRELVAKNGVVRAYDAQVAMAKELHAVELQCQELRDAMVEMLEYVRHEEGCSAHFGANLWCRCGLEEKYPNWKKLSQYKETS